jgi:hypothetical protein
MRVSSGSFEIAPRRRAIGQVQIGPPRAVRPRVEHVERVQSAFSGQRAVAGERVRHELEQREQRRERVHGPTGLEGPERDQHAVGWIRRRDEPAQGKDRARAK